jgi:diamine N-acetyltransferase
VTGSKDPHRPSARAVPVVRERRASDSRVVRKIARLTWRATYEGRVPTSFIRAVLRRGYDRERLLLSLVDRRRDVFVVEWSGRVVGYADLVEGPPFEAELTRIYVLPEFQGSGCGRALLERCFAAARVRGARRVVLGVDPGNVRSIAWYQRQGFVSIGTEPFTIGAISRSSLRMARHVS